MHQLLRDPVARLLLLVALLVRLSFALEVCSHRLDLSANDQLDMIFLHENAKRIADDLAAALPDLVVSNMDKRLRTGKVFIDWSQNNGAKTTIAPYSLRGIDRPTVSTPLTWDEVSEASSASDLVFTADQVTARVRDIGDLLGTLDDVRAALPTTG